MQYRQDVPLDGRAHNTVIGQCILLPVITGQSTGEWALLRLCLGNIYIYIYEHKCKHIYISVRVIMSKCEYRPYGTTRIL